ncbi:hypothetical protein BVY01_03515 [bacterium I07]|nr:hypothetical protein BVY01_03515 [bacterium I07]
MSVWDQPAARHILSRTRFGFTGNDVEYALSYSLDDFVDNVLLADANIPEPPGEWVDEDPISNNTTVNNSRLKDLTAWWVDLMLSDESFREKMVLFWHNHFVSEYNVVDYPQYMYIQNQLFRSFAFGNIKNLTKSVCIDPAMLIYLDGKKNKVGKPNENFARELLELFTLGIGHYTENDIVEAARALTGWRIAGLGSVFKPSRFDNGVKTFLGSSGNFNHEDIVELIFSQDAASKWFCQKIYTAFVHYNPDDTIIDGLAELLRASNFELKPVLSTLLKSQYFHSEDIRGARIKSPVDLVVGSIKRFAVQDPDYSYIRTSVEDLQQELFEPPDVRGWEGQRKWISTNTYPMRNQFTDSIISGKKPNGRNMKFQVDVLGFAREFPSSENAEEFVNEVTQSLIQFPISETRIQSLLETLLDGAAPYDWSTYDPQAESRLQKFFMALMRLPEFQLS